MGRRNRMTIQKRQRERKKAEKAAMKREQRAQREKPEADGDAVATVDDLEALGIVTGSDQEKN